MLLADIEIMTAWIAMTIVTCVSIWHVFSSYIRFQDIRKLIVYPGNYKIEKAEKRFKNSISLSVIIFFTDAIFIYSSVH